MVIAERRRFEAELADLEVFPPDRRARVPPAQTLAIPNRWICRLTAPDIDATAGSYGMGTGVLIGPRHVLTAAHVLVSVQDQRRTVGDRLRVQIARNGETAPFAPVGIRGWRVNPRWVRAIQQPAANGRPARTRWILQPQHDYGLVTLDRDVSSWPIGPCTLGHWGAAGPCANGAFIGMAPADVQGQQAVVTGYPGDKGGTALWTAGGPISLEPRLGTLLHTIDTCPGQSGAPVWAMQGDRCQLIGVHSGANGRWTTDANHRQVLSHNGAALLSPAVVQQLRLWMGTSARP
ncbi:hypothetical protein TBR22_A06500 [Luteitalea sp. TBR-22]|uniref:trypsin-like serine peptidase n=1 Tax=Luteitalea sp. TBR-22 TaxID=2802971 RepID=UPI001AFA14DD|nr:trypsin-like peptidase domain-containing protein [Luteitalea sp. TBR-22]BCS31449.1 hypothetical protein TBR22_A06500 [Luteitalea sp. TBR-22]